MVLLDFQFQSSLLAAGLHDHAQLIDSAHTGYEFKFDLNHSSAEISCGFVNWDLGLIIFGFFKTASSTL